MSKTMTAAPQSSVIRFVIPDLSRPGEDLALFSTPELKDVKDLRQELHDARTDTKLLSGSEGLDAQGFTYVRHESGLKGLDAYLQGTNVEDVHIPEIEKLVRDVTGAKKVIVNNMLIRRKQATNQEEPLHVNGKGDGRDNLIGKLPKDRALVVGREEGSSREPARKAHVDYTLWGLKETVRKCRKDIRAAAEGALAAEDAVKGGAQVQVPRYAAYSVWRPIETIQRDPLAVADWRTTTRDCLAAHTYRVPSDIVEEGEYMNESYIATPPNNPKQLKWYWMPNQKPDEVLIIKNADSFAEKDPNVAGGCLHVSPFIEGADEDNVRVSIETRVIAFW